MLRTENLSCGYGDHMVLEGVDFSAKPGELICILGSNGSGKSTLIKTIVGLERPLGGRIEIEGEDIRGWSFRKRARYLSYIPQTFSANFQYKCMDIVLMGRTAYLGFASSPSKEDEKIASRAFETLKINHLKDKIYSQLSGGERQLVKIAQAITQEARIIIMDEPANNLDFGNQITLFNHLVDCKNMGITIIMVTHSPEHAFLYASKVLLVKEGRVMEIEEPNSNLKEEDLRNIYEVDLNLVELDWKDRMVKVCIPDY
ncbi:MAG: ABC transporter ATP-binding protein [Tissierellia bacterium]|nr:ABC transporter ATP-binding protein [Tissierellia bacterium]